MTENSGCSIALMKEEDVPAVAALSKRCFSLPWTEDGYRLEMRKPGSICLSAWVEEALAGFLCASSVLDEAELCLIATVPELRRQGIAGALMEPFLTLCREREIAVVHLEVRASNTAAAALYRRYGFQQDGLRKGYYRLPSEDAVLYSLQL